MNNNPPYKIVELSEEQYRFLLENCDSNLEFGLRAMMSGDFSRQTLEQLVDLNEKFKSVKTALERAI